MSNIYETYQVPSSGEGVYLKLDDGDSVRLRIASEPYVFNNEFTDKDTGEKSVTTRYAWIVYNYDLDKAQIMQHGVRVFRTIQNLAVDPEWGDPTSYDLKLTRKGTRTDTEYHVTPSPQKAPLTADQKAAVAALDIHRYIDGAQLLTDLEAGVTPPADVVPDELDLDNIDFGA